ncbi:family 43 glycosylhydrolase [Micromonospora parva]|uniref:family 43 glycosylhydrolase n=1 Tax=Micromonospora parva TaxID=1464048 RepID=UPI003F4CDB0F
MVVLAPAATRADNPIVQTIYTADPAALVHNGRVYLYTGHDEDGSTYFTMKEWRVYSSADMVNWTDHGVPMNLATFSWASADAWAGQTVYRNGRFYWYVPVKNRATGRMAIGVAVSDSPTGPFRDAIGRPLVENGEIDPHAFVDDDGQAYLYWGNPNLWYVRLNADMTSFSGSPTRIPLTTAGFGARSGNTSRPTLYEEAPWVYKRNGTYYNIFAAECCSEFIAYSTAPGPTGPWTYRGTIMPRQGNAFTNHPAIVDFSGGSYFFYHNGALPGGGGFTRSVAVEKFSYRADGTIPTITMTTSGAPQVGTLNPYLRQEAETIAWSSGVETEPASEGGMNVGWIENGDYIKVKGVALGSGATSFTARVASASNGGRIEVRLGSTSGTTVGTCNVGVTGGWQAWTTVSCPVSGATGTQDVYLRFAGGSGNLFNVNWWQFGQGSTPPPTTPPPTTPPPTTPPPTTPPPSGSDCRVTATVNAWNSGLTEDITITNTSSTTVNGWSLAFGLPSGQSITAGWNATYAPTSGQVTARNVSHNSAISPGASVSIGFQANHTGNTAAPSTFTLNGATCAR